MTGAADGRDGSPFPLTGYLTFARILVQFLLDFSHPRRVHSEFVLEQNFVRTPWRFLRLTAAVAVPTLVNIFCQEIRLV